jgi:hypothetical protein
VLLILLGPALLAAQLVMDLSKGREQVVLDAQQWVRGRLAELPGDLADVIGVGFVCAVALAAWWLMLGIILRLWPYLPQVVFLPFADKFNRRHANAVRNLGLCLAAFCLISGAAMW